MADIKRQTAIKCTIKQIRDSEYVQQQGWEPNYLEIQGRKVSRINILAAIVSKENNTITIDDSTGQINIIMFSNQERAENLDIADILLIIGRPREYGGQRYVVPEILKKIEDKRWVLFRRQELALQKDVVVKKVTPIENASRDISVKKSLQQKTDEIIKKNSSDSFKQEMPKINIQQKIINAIKKLDVDSGANIEDVIKEVNMGSAEEQITNMINEGEIFEIRPGKIKVI